MRMSCNGCRVLRKGCSDDCAIRPCLQWIKSPESQANATVFLAKFYGRAGLINLIAAGPHHLRPAIFRSLLYEACGRIVNPIYGSVGLLWSGSWGLCQAAVEAVLKGEPIAQITSDAAAAAPAPPLKAGDIRHLPKRARSPADQQLHKVARTRSRSKRSATPVEPVIEMERAEWSEPGTVSAEGSHVSQAEPEGEAEVGGLDLDLNLGLAGGSHHRQAGPASEVRPAAGEWNDDACQVELELRPPAM